MYSNNPLVSICIPSFNSEKYIVETLTSLFNQTYQHIEIIVVDDGSTDNTVNKLASIKDSRFTFTVQQNKGASSARNKAYSLSTGEYIKFMDADDLINPDFINAQLNKILHHPGCIASAKWGRFYHNDISTFKLSPEKIWKDLRGIDWLIESLVDSGGNMMQSGIFLIPRYIIETAGPWNEQLSLIDDFDYMTRVILTAENILFCKDSVLMYRSGGSGNLSGQKSSDHLQSAFNALNLGIANILQSRNDTTSRLASANTYQRWAYQFYPQRKDLCKQAEKKIQELGGSDIEIEGGKALVLLSKILGWKLAIQIKLLLQKNLPV